MTKTAYLNQPLLSTQVAHDGIDRSYSRFTAGLKPDVAAAARDLPRRLGLAEVPNLPWSELAEELPLLALPALLGRSERLELPREVLRAASEAHVFACLGALGIDGIRRRLIDEDAAAVAAVYELHRARDRALGIVVGSRESLDYAAAEALRREALADEELALAGREAATRGRYRMIALKKESLAFPAPLAAAAAAGWSAADRARVDAVVGGVALGIALRRDAAEWAEDHLRGASWAVALLAEAIGPRIRRADVASLTSYLHAAGVIVELLKMASRALTSAAEAARDLGARELASWAIGEARMTSSLALFESVEAGYVRHWAADRRERRRQRLLVRTAS
ncbi:MAG: hypothetical protein H6711_29885 [Myxococcales bacterium]|nr:hypothetical protein [Myxococcales bacterium]